MARVGILTFHQAINYGAVLQAYGLAETLRHMGHCVRVIDYRPPATRRTFTNWGLRSGHPIATVIKRIRLRRFRQHCLPLTQRVFLTHQDLREHLPPLDVLVCGSDQVWNVDLKSYGGFDPAFFLAFSGEATRRVSYAATFGYAEDLGEHRGTIRSLLRRFDHLSVRDRRSQRMVAMLTGRTPVHVLDPVFLSDYELLTSSAMTSEPYILAYCMDKTAFFARAIRLLRRCLNMPVVSINVDLDETRVIRSAGPRQWLTLMRHAAFVCTNSFHGTCFALALQKQFVALPTRCGQFRLEDILETAGLTDRLVGEEDQLVAAARTPVDHAGAAERLAEMVERSQDFLRNALS